MALSGRTKLGITIAVAVVAGLASVFFRCCFCCLPALNRAGQIPERTETFIKGLPYGDSLLRALAKLDMALTDRI